MTSHPASPEDSDFDPRSADIPADSELPRPVTLSGRTAARLWIDGSIAVVCLLLAAAGGWWIISAFVGGSAVSSAVADPAAPLIYVADLVLDLGDVALDDGDVVPVSFRYENRGGAPLTIAEVVTTCSCTSASASRRVTPPGEFGEINVQVKRSTLGRGSAMLLVYSNDPRTRKLELKCQWNGVARLQFDQPALHFGDILPGAAVGREIKLMFTDRQRFPACQAVQFKLSPEIQVTPKAGAFLKQPLSNETLFQVTLQAGRQLGAGSGRILCEFQGCYKDEFVIPVTWNVRSRIQATPQQLYLQTGRPGETLKKRLVITSTAPEQLAIQSVQLIPEGIGTATLRKISAVCQEVEVSVPLTSASKILQVIVRLECLEPVKETLEIPWSGVMLPPKAQ
jgi:hypothetical protein